MASIAEIRKKFPQYDDLSDEELAGAMHRKFYSDLPREEFNEKIGLKAQSPKMKEGLAELSAITQNPSKAAYDALPAWKKPLVAASDVVSLAGDATTFGYGTKAAAKARALTGGKSYEDELVEQRRLLDAARKRSGSAGLAAEVTGAVAAPLGLASKGLTLAGRGGTAAMKGLPGLGARTGLMGAEGAGYGALTAAGNDQNIGTGALIGTAGGVGGNLIGEGIAGGVGKIAGAFNPKAPRLTVDDLKTSGARSLKEAEAQGVVFNREGVARLKSTITDDLTEHGFHPDNEAGILPVLKQLDAIEAGPGNITLKGLHTLRKTASNGYRMGNKSNNLLVGKVVGRIDEMINAADPSTMAATGDPRAAAAAFGDFKKNWSSARKLETVEDLVERGALNAGASGAGGNVENATRQQLKRILLNQGMKRGFNPLEQVAAKKAVMGSPTQNVARLVGKLSPEGNGLGLLMHALAGVGTLGATVPLAALGVAGKRTAEALARKSVSEFIDLVARGGVPAPVLQNAIQLLSKEKRTGLSRALNALIVHQTRRREEPA